MNSLITIIYWIIHIICIALIGMLLENYVENNKKDRFTFYFLFFILFTAICLGPVYRIICAADADIEQKQEFKTNATLPKGMYYLGCEIVRIKEYTADDTTYYLYDFDTVDDEEWEGHIFQYSTTERLEYDNKYLLTMDGMGTDDITDDEIAIVWSHIW